MSEAPEVLAFFALPTGRPMENHAMEQNPTIRIENIEGYSAVKMVWERDVTAGDVQRAFQEIRAMLAGSDQPLTVMVDLSCGPTLPVRNTLAAARPFFRHPQVQVWLIVGSNWSAKTLESTLAWVTGQRNVLWFASESEAHAYLVKNPANHSHYGR